MAKLRKPNIEVKGKGKEAIPENFNEFPVDKIAIDQNIRDTYNQNELKELALSIKSDGQLQPIGITNQSEDGKHKIVYGHRRFLAIRDHLKAKTIKAVLVNDYQNRTQIQLIENIQRTDLTDYEIAKALKELKESIPKTTNKDLAKKLNKSVDWIDSKMSHISTIENLKKNRVDTVFYEKLPSSKINEIRSLSQEKQKEVLEESIKNNLSQKDIREKVKQVKKEDEWDAKQKEKRKSFKALTIEHIKFLRSDSNSLDERYNYYNKINIGEYPYSSSQNMIRLIFMITKMDQNDIWRNDAIKSLIEFLEENLRK